MELSIEIVPKHRLPDILLSLHAVRGLLLWVVWTQLTAPFESTIHGGHHLYCYRNLFGRTSEQRIAQLLTFGLEVAGLIRHSTQCLKCVDYFCKHFGRIPWCFLPLFRKSDVRSHPVKAWNISMDIAFWGLRVCAMMWADISLRVLPVQNKIHISVKFVCIIKDNYIILEASISSCISCMQKKPSICFLMCARRKTTSICSWRV